MSGQLRIRLAGPQTLLRVLGGGAPLRAATLDVGCEPADSDPASGHRRHFLRVWVVRERSADEGKLRQSSATLRDEEFGR